MSKTPEKLAEDMPLSAVEFMKLPLEKRRQIMESMITQEMIEYYEQVVKELEE
jgi:hypothetical protein